MARETKAERWNFVSALNKTVASLLQGFASDLAGVHRAWYGLSARERKALEEEKKRRLEAERKARAEVERRAQEETERQHAEAERQSKLEAERLLVESEAKIKGEEEGEIGEIKVERAVDPFQRKEKPKAKKKKRH